MSINRDVAGMHRHIWIDGIRVLQNICPVSCSSLFISSGKDLLHKRETIAVGNIAQQAWDDTFVWTSSHQHLSELTHRQHLQSTTLSL